jgi:uncharacterized protein (TIGR03086 family)
MDDGIELASLTAACEAVRDMLDPPFTEDMHKPTPNPGWDVGVLFDHVMDLTVRIGAAAGIVVCDKIEASPQQRLAAVVGPVVEGWRRRQMQGEIIWRTRRLADPVAINVLTLDIVVHGWDLSVALGRVLKLSEPRAQYLLKFAHDALTDDVRADSGFGPPVAGYESGGSTLDRLVAFTGRDPSNWDKSTAEAVD